MAWGGLFGKLAKSASRVSRVARGNNSVGSGVGGGIKPRVSGSASRSVGRAVQPRARISGSASRNVGSAVRKPIYSTPRRSSSGSNSGYSGGGSSGGSSNYSGGGQTTPGSFSGGGGGEMSGGGSFAATAMPAPVPTVENITIPAAASEAAYQAQIAELARSQADFNAQQKLADDQYTGSYNQGMRKLGVVGGKLDPTLANGQYGQSLNANTNDFAARNLVHSGEFVKSRADLDSDFNSRIGEIDRARTDFRDTAALSKRNFTAQNDAVKQKAMQDAIAAIASRYGVGTNQVSRHQSSTIQRPV